MVCDEGAFKHQGSSLLAIGTVACSATLIVVHFLLIDLFRLLQHSFLTPRLLCCFSVVAIRVGAFALENGAYVAQRLHRFISP